MTETPTASKPEGSGAKSPVSLSATRHFPKITVGSARDFRMPKRRNDERTEIIQFRIPSGLHDAIKSLLAQEGNYWKTISGFMYWAAGRAVDEVHEGNADGDPFLDDWSKTYQAEKHASFNAEAAARNKKTLDCTIDHMLLLLWCEDFEEACWELELIWEKTACLQTRWWRGQNIREFGKVKLFRATVRVLTTRGFGLSADLASVLGV